MADPATVDRTSSTGTGSRLRSRVTTRQLYGITCGVLSAGLFAVMFGFTAQNSFVTLPVGVSAGLLLAFAYNLVLERDVTYTEWTDDERNQWLIGAGLLVLTTGVVVVSFATFVAQL